MAEIRGGQRVVRIHDAEITIDPAQNMGANQPTHGNQHAHKHLAPGRPAKSDLPSTPHSDFLLIMVTAAPISVNLTTPRPSRGSSRKSQEGKEKGQGSHGRVPLPLHQE